MIYALLAQLLFLTSVSSTNDQPASCELVSKSVVSRTSSGVAQISNLGVIEITCRVPGRPFPTKPGDSRNGLTVVTSAYKIISVDASEPVPSEVKLSGGGSRSAPRSEWVNFYVHIPLESAERDAEVQRYLDKFYKALGPDQVKQITEEQRQKAPERLREFVYQNRVGRFQMQCRVMDGDRVMGVDTVEFEVLFKGRFSDSWLAGAPPA